MTPARPAPDLPSHGPVGPLPAGQGRDDLLAEVTRVLAPIDDGTPVVIGCSGGPDSTALLHLVVEARPDLAVLVVVVRHGFRDDTADVDNVRRHATWAGVPCDVIDVEVVRTGKGLEAAARDARYMALRQAARRHGGKILLVGHTADDQAETVLLRAVRGTGVDGLAAMRVVTGDVWRPMLRIRRVDVHRFVHFEGLPITRDPMNDDPAYRRSVVRNEVLAELDKVGDDPVGALGRLADLAAADADVLEGLADEAYAKLAGKVGDVVVLPAAATMALADGIARRVVRAAISAVTGAVPDAADVTRALALPVHSAVSLAGSIDVARSEKWLTVAPRLAAHQPPASLTIPGAAVWRPARVTIQAITADSDPWHVATNEQGHVPGQVALALPDAWHPPGISDDVREPPAGGHASRMVIALPALDMPLVVRRREAGDRMLTAGGTRSLQDVMVDAGIPRAIRDIWPVVASDETLVWIPGIAADATVVREGRRNPMSQLRVTRSGVAR